VSCDKIGYSRDVALKELRRMQQTMRGGKIPIRIYYCREHKAWHHTSKPKRKG